MKTKTLKHGERILREVYKRGGTAQTISANTTLSISSIRRWLSWFLKGACIESHEEVRNHRLVIVYTDVDPEPNEEGFQFNPLRLGDIQFLTKRAAGV